MDGPNKNQTPKKVFSAPKNPNSGVKESNENECNKLQNQKKPVSKHFMSPTISAASKVSTPRKKILGERNGIPPFSDTPALKSPSLGPRTDRSGQFSPKMMQSYNNAAESDDEEKSASAVTAYDPSSSYLSPRPKYLRYNPNRKREVFLQLESMGGKEGDDGSGGDESDFQNVGEEVGEEFEEENDFQNVEDEVEKSEIIQCLDANRGDDFDSENGTFDSENGTSQVVEKMDNYEDEVEENDDEEVEDVNRSEVFDSEKITSQDNRSDVFDSVEVTSAGVVKMHNCEDEVEENDEEEVDDLNEEAEESEEVHGWILKRILKFVVVLCLFLLATFFAVSIHSTVLNSEEVTGGPKDISEDVSMGVVTTLVKNHTGYGLAQEFRVENHSFMEESEAQSPEVLLEAGMVESEISNWMINEPVDNMLEDSTVGELADAHAVESNSYCHEGSDSQSPELLAEANMVESELINIQISGPVDDMLEDATVGELTYSDAEEFNLYGNEESEAQSPELLVEADMVEPEVDDMFEDATEGELTDSHAKEPTDESTLSGNEDNTIVEESINTMAAEDTKLQQSKNTTTRSIIVVVISSLLSIISGFLVYIFRSKGRQASEVSPISIEKLDSTEAPCPGTPKAEERKEKLAQPCAAAPSVFSFSEQAAKEFSQMRSPTVQLLGEIVVREVERSLRRCDKKVADELIESEESSNFLDRKKKKANFPTSSPSPATLDYSIADSPSCYGSFTTEAKILKKENGQDAEFTTPVRRSSRIRSRSVTPLP